MKKIALILALLAVLCCASCGGAEKADDVPAAQTAAAQPLHQLERIVVQGGGGLKTDRKQVLSLRAAECFAEKGHIVLGLRLGEHCDGLAKACQHFALITDIAADYHGGVALVGVQPAFER